MSGQGSFLALLRRLERDNPHRPRIGRSVHLTEEIVDLGQDPRLEFPVTEFHREPGQPELPRDGIGRVALRPQFLGMFGAFGALPLNTIASGVRRGGSSARGEPPSDCAAARAAISPSSTASCISGRMALTSPARNTRDEPARRALASRE